MTSVTMSSVDVVSGIVTLSEAGVNDVKQPTRSIPIPRAQFELPSIRLGHCPARVVQPSPDVEYAAVGSPHGDVVTGRSSVPRNPIPYSTVLAVRLADDFLPLGTKLADGLRKLATRSPEIPSTLVLRRLPRHAGSVPGALGSSHPLTGRLPLHLCEEPEDDSPRRLVPQNSPIRSARSKSGRRRTW